MTDIKKTITESVGVTDDLSAVELSKDDWLAELEIQSESLIGMSTAALTTALSTGEADREDWRVEYLAGLLESA